MAIEYTWDTVEATVDPTTNNVTHWRFLLSGTEGEYNSLMGVTFNHLPADYETDDDGVVSITHEEIKLTPKPLSEYTKEEVTELAELVAEKNGWKYSIEKSLENQKLQPIIINFDII